MFLNRTFLLILAYLVATGILAAFSLRCGKGKSDKNVPVNTGTVLKFPTGIIPSQKTDVSGIIIATLDESLAQPQILTTSENSNIRDIKVAFPTGSLPKKTTVSLQEGEAIDSTQLVGDLGLDSAIIKVTASAAPIMITASEAIDLNQSMILSLAVPKDDGTTKLNFITARKDKIAVVYRVLIQESGKRISGVTPVSSLSIDQGKIIFTSKYFGWFQVVIFNQAVVAKEVESTLPLYSGIQMLLSGMMTPSCGKADLGRTIYVLEDKTFKYCSATGWTAIDLTGPAGAAGAAGVKGEKGATGTAGSSGGSNLYVYDVSGNKVGTFLSGSFTQATTGSTLTSFVRVGSQTDSNLAYFFVDLNGGFSSPYVYINTYSTIWNYVSSGYQSSDCSGTPYVPSSVGVTKNNLFVSASGTYYRMTGSETAAASGTLSSFYYNGSCRATTINSITAYHLTGSYTFPSDVRSPPYSTPLYIGE
ncbi:MAG: hypothetical protein HQK54_00815 [Oligoflexales bacterium]|nr:hypothetical protein [Oligoflexales bacterium]